MSERPYLEFLSRKAVESILTKTRYHVSRDGDVNANTNFGMIDFPFHRKGKWHACTLPFTLKVHYRFVPTSTIIISQDCEILQLFSYEHEIIGNWPTYSIVNPSGTVAPARKYRFPDCWLYMTFEGFGMVSGVTEFS